MRTDPIRILVIGEAYVDLHLNVQGYNLHRLGGVFHSVRAFHALVPAREIEYSIAVITPGYLKPSILKYCQELGVSKTLFLGEVNDAPNVMIVSESTEAGDQGYIDILKEQAQVDIKLESIRSIVEQTRPTDILIYPGKYRMVEVLGMLSGYSGRIHVDFQYDYVGVEEILNLDIRIETFITSTSSQFFQQNCSGSSKALAEAVLPKSANCVVLKENRGGSRYIGCLESEWVSAPSFPTQTSHSVGVGDCYNAIYVILMAMGYKPQLAIRGASYAASLYASHWRHDAFVNEMEPFLNLVEELEEFTGICLPWDIRRDKHIYIAAPDFPDVDTSLLDTVEACLKYHNFTPHRPIQENGLCTPDKTQEEQLRIYNDDIMLLEKCDLLVAVLLYNDPGTLVEVGWMAAKGRPTILFDPNFLATNLFLKHTVNAVCHNLGELIDNIYILLGKGRE